MGSERDPTRPDVLWVAPGYFAKEIQDDFVAPDFEHLGFYDEQEFESNVFRAELSDGRAARWHSDVAISRVCELTPNRFLVIRQSGPAILQEV